MAVEFEATRKMIYDAATQGDLPTFQHLIHDDPYLLDAVSFSCSRNVVHIAAMCGQLAIVEEALRIHPRLARSLDSQQSAPLHLAAEEGSAAIASKLIAVAPAVCWLRDCHGLNPVHIAAMNGHAEVLEELLRHDPSPAREKVDRGQTAMHLCVKRGQLRALRVLVGKTDELVRAEDDDGETVLLLAVRFKQVEMVQYLSENNELGGNLTNSIGKTASQIAIECCRDATYSEMTKALTIPAELNGVTRLRWTGNIALVVVIMIASMAFQATINPPGGVWQDDSMDHKAGTSIMASKHPEKYKKFMESNLVSIATSGVTIMILSMPYSSTVFSHTTTLWIGMFVSMISLYSSCLISIDVLSPDTGMIVVQPSTYIFPAVGLYLNMVFLPAWIS